MFRPAAAIFIPLCLVTLLLAAGCQRKVIRESYRPSTGTPVGTAVPFNQPNQPMNLIGDSSGYSGKQLPEGMRAMFDWAEQHKSSSGPRFTPKTFGD